MLNEADELLNHLYIKSASIRISDVKSFSDECARPVRKMSGCLV